MADEKDTKNGTGVDIEREIERLVREKDAADECPDGHVVAFDDDGVPGYVRLEDEANDPSHVAMRGRLDAKRARSLALLRLKQIADWLARDSDITQEQEAILVRRVGEMWNALHWREMKEERHARLAFVRAVASAAEDPLVGATGISDEDRLALRVLRVRELFWPAHPALAVRLKNEQIAACVLAWRPTRIGRGRPTVDQRRALAASWKPILIALKAMGLPAQAEKDLRADWLALARDARA